jgi:hypothetical protein
MLSEAYSLLNGLTLPGCGEIPQSEFGAADLEGDEGDSGHGLIILRFLSGFSFRTRSAKSFGPLGIVFLSLLFFSFNFSPDSD